MSMTSSACSIRKMVCYQSMRTDKVLEGDTRCIRERLLLDAIEGERRLFIRSDDLDAAWSLFTPLLKEIEEKKRIPEYYPYGSRGPVGAHYLAAKHKVQWGNISPDQ
ncbi:hypothetical protein Bca52824_056618 [Brassica carinata]|uniref:Glucose-6-phosphate dehydrogenase C-terminal domain-containing protein n=1 Tax=Brassica carinata TaxID=52824 RepID=A0A8X7QQU5_BRACI|nr:hypothetical protein Bca52824_056618 [Brassica carinata]